MTRSVLIIFIALASFSFQVYGQEERRLIRQGNQMYEDQKYNEAEAQYRRALEANSQDHRAMFNLGNSLYKQGRYEEAAEIFEILSQTASKDTDKASAWHNLGNSYLSSQQIKEGIEAYKNALRISPESDDTRHNLAYAMQLLQEPPPEDQQQQGDEQAEDDQDQDQQQPGEDDQQQAPQGQDQQPQPRPDQISPQDAERILDALNQQEQKVQQELNKEEQRVPARVLREW